MTTVTSRSLITVNKKKKKKRERSEYYIFDLIEAKASLKGIQSEDFTRWEEEATLQLDQVALVRSLVVVIK